MNITSQRKNVLTKESLSVGFNKSIKPVLLQLNPSNYMEIIKKPIPMCVIYSPKTEKIHFLTEGNVTNALEKKSNLRYSYFKELTEYCYQLKMRGSGIADIREYFVTKVLEEADKKIRPYIYSKEIVFKRNSRYALFKSLVDLGYAEPRTPQTQDTIQRFFSLNYRDVYNTMLAEGDTIETINRKIGYLFIDTIRSGMVGFNCAEKGVYYFDFSNVHFEFKDNSVILTSNEEFIPVKGIFWSEGGVSDLKKGNSVEISRARSANHPLSTLFEEYNIPSKYLPRSKKELSNLRNYCAKKYSRLEYNKINMVLNDWAS